MWIAPVLMLALFFASSVKAQEQLDRIEGKIDTIINKHDRTLNIFDVEPLTGKKYGIEINPVRIVSMNKDEKTLSGTISFFHVRPNVEIAIPFFYSVTSFLDDDYDSHGPFYSTTIDVHYRNFLRNKTDGFYISALSRLAILRGDVGDDLFLFDSHPPSGARETTLKLGIGFGIGYRIFSNSGWYWGTSLSAGRYLIGENDKYVSMAFSYDDDSEYILDVELLKFGYSF